MDIIYIIDLLLLHFFIYPPKTVYTFWLLEITILYIILLNCSIRLYYDNI